MKRVFSISFVLLATLLLLVFAVAPHHHHNQQVCLKTEICETNCDAQNEKHEHGNCSEDSQEHEALCVFELNRVAPTPNNKANCTEISFASYESTILLLFPSFYADLVKSLFLPITNRRYVEPTILYKSVVLGKSRALRAPPVLFA